MGNLASKIDKDVQGIRTAKKTAFRVLIIGSATIVGVALLLIVLRYLRARTILHLNEEINVELLKLKQAGVTTTPVMTAEDLKAWSAGAEGAK
jgi:hypothetical protein